MTNVDINSKYNLVSINKGLHKHLHTNGYHRGVESFLQQCVTGITQGSKAYTSRVMVGLGLIAAMLKSASRLF